MNIILVLSIISYIIIGYIVSVISLIVFHDVIEHSILAGVSWIFWPFMIIILILLGILLGVVFLFVKLEKLFTSKKILLKVKWLKYLWPETLARKIRELWKK